MLSNFEFVPKDEIFMIFLKKSELGKRLGRLSSFVLNLQSLQMKFLTAWKTGYKSLRCAKSIKNIFAYQKCFIYMYRLCYFFQESLGQELSDFKNFLSKSYDTTGRYFRSMSEICTKFESFVGTLEKKTLIAFGESNFIVQSFNNLLQSARVLVDNFLSENYDLVSHLEDLYYYADLMKS
ncbi:MAG: hypothetical protein MHPSP_003929, partial [Paramarteilia canceri]